MILMMSTTITVVIAVVCAVVFAVIGFVLGSVFRQKKTPIGARVYFSLVFPIFFLL